jgi:hypothetical protein
MEARCAVKPAKPFYYCTAYWWVLRQIANVRLHVGRATGTYRAPLSLDDMDRLCFGHGEALPYPYDHPIWKERFAIR